uniref:G-protein coupled receptors family 1 profile domain-containing protein n=1 Tax=Panagrolaimus sp. JU765 TaxID=591449 RepID=A0AC34QMI0_9BILA
MVLGPQYSSSGWQQRHPVHSRNELLRINEDQIIHSQVFKAVMDTLANMLNNTASTLLGNESLLINSGINITDVANVSDYIASDDITYNYIGISDHTRALIIIVIGVVFAVVTTLGNLMVMVSFKIDKQLQSISNYFLFSLAVADITIGVISIPLMTYYTATGYWGIGYTMCQFWLCIDYLMSNASVLNLLLISFDRYFSVTRPLTYRPRRTTKKAMTMIAITYIVSLILWPPWIISWPYIEGEFTIEPGACVVQFLETNPYVTVGTAFAAFYLPVTIMIYLYSRVYCETKRRQREFRKLQAGQMRNRTSVQSPTNNFETSGSLKRKQFFPFMDGLVKPKIDKKKRKCGWLRSCAGKSEFSSEESSEV